MASVVPHLTAGVLCICACVEPVRATVLTTAVGWLAVVDSCPVQARRFSTKREAMRWVENMVGEGYHPRKETQ